MVVIRKLWETDPIEYLVQSKFPNMLMMGRAARKSTDLAVEFRNRQTDAEAYRNHLMAMPAGDRQLLIAKARQDETKRREEYRETQERNQFFNQPRAETDVAHWSAASYWTLDEAAALSLGKDPRVVSWKAVSPHVNISPFAKTFEARRDLVYRAGVMGQLAHQTAPSVIIAWAERMYLPMPVNLVEAVKALGNQIADWKTLHDDLAARVEQLQAKISKMREDEDRIGKSFQEVTAKKDEIVSSLKQECASLSQQIADLQEAQPAAMSERPLKTRERESLLKLVIGMAIDCYGYDPKAARSPISKEIADNLALLELSIDEDTVRKYLTAAKELLPRDETEQNR